MQDRLARHFAPAEATVLGQLLRPYSLWHWRTLAMLGSPFVMPQGDLTFAELAIAVRVCRHRPNSNLRFLKPRFWELPALAWRRHLYAARVEEEIDTLFEYIKHYTAGPVPKPRGHADGTTSAGSGSLKTHGCLYLAAGLLDIGYSKSEAWAETPGMAKWLLAGLIEARGGELNIIGEDWIRDALASGYTLEDCGMSPGD